MCRLSYFSLFVIHLRGYDLTSLGSLPVPVRTPPADDASFYSKKSRPRSEFAWSVPSSPVEIRSPTSRTPFALYGPGPVQMGGPGQRALLTARPSLEIIRSSMAPTHRSTELFTPLLPLPPSVIFPCSPRVVDELPTLPRVYTQGVPEQSASPTDYEPSLVARSFLAVSANRKRPELSLIHI